MTSNDILQQGERAKYLATFTRQDFDPETMDFYVEILYGMMGKKLTITKSQMITTTSGEWIFSFDTSEMIGKITARMVMQFDDTDMVGSVRQEVDEQVIAFIVSVPCPKYVVCPGCTGTHDVTYVRTEEGSLASLYMRLVATETEITVNPLVTTDGDNIFVLRVS